MAKLKVFNFVPADEKVPDDDSVHKGDIFSEQELEVATMKTFVIRNTADQNVTVTIYGSLILPDEDVDDTTFELRYKQLFSGTVSAGGGLEHQVNPDLWTHFRVDWQYAAAPTIGALFEAFMIYS